MGPQIDRAEAFSAMRCQREVQASCWLGVLPHLRFGGVQIASALAQSRTGRHKPVTVGGGREHPRQNRTIGPRDSALVKDGVWRESR